MGMTGTGAAASRETEHQKKSDYKLRVLLVEDNASDAELMLRALHKDGFEVSATVVQTADEFRRQIRERRSEERRVGKECSS